MMEIQVHGMISNTEDFELKLRAAGSHGAMTFKVEEVVMSVPSVPGTVQGRVRIVPNADAEESSLMIHEVEVQVDKEDVVRVVSQDRVELKGNTKQVLRLLGFKEERQIGRIGTRVMLPNEWQVEYFSLFEPSSSRSNGKQSSSRKRAAYVLEKGPTGLLVTIKKQFKSDEKDSNSSYVGDAWRVIRRLSPEFQPLTCNKIISDNPE